MVGLLVYEIKNFFLVIWMNVEFLVEDFEEINIVEMRWVIGKIDVVKK